MKKNYIIKLSSVLYSLFFLINCGAKSTLQDFYVSDSGIENQDSENLDSENQDINPTETETWSIKLGNENLEYIYSMIEVNDGYVLAGANSLSVNDYYDVWIVKLDLHGNIVWQKSYGGEMADAASKIIETDNGFIIAGETQSFGNGSLAYSDILIINLDKDGNVIWQKTYGIEEYEQFGDIIKSKNGGYIISGSTLSLLDETIGNDMLVMKIDNNGNILWQKAINPAGSAFANSIIEKDNGNIVIAGNSSFVGTNWCPFYSNLIVIELTAQGDYISNKSITREDMVYYSISSIKSSDGIIIASIYDNPCTNTISTTQSIIKLDENLNFVWGKKIDDDCDGTVYYSSIAETEDNGFVFVGKKYCNYYPLPPEFGVYGELLLKIDDDGNIVWSKGYFEHPFDVEDSHSVYFRSVIDSSDNGIVISVQYHQGDSLPYTLSDLIILKLDNQGELDNQSCEYYSSNVIELTDVYDQFIELDEIDIMEAYLPQQDSYPIVNDTNTNHEILSMCE